MSMRQEIRERREGKRRALAALAELAAKAHEERIKTGRAKLGTDGLLSVSYNTVHQRLRRARGPASDHACSHCGETAHDWAYDHGDPSRLIESGFPYSLDPDHYLPLCRPCHLRLDRKGC